MGWCTEMSTRLLIIVYNMVILCLALPASLPSSNMNATKEEFMRVKVLYRKHTLAYPIHINPIKMCGIPDTLTSTTIFNHFCPNIKQHMPHPTVVHLPIHQNNYTKQVFLNMSPKKRSLSGQPSLNSEIQFLTY